MGVSTGASAHEEDDGAPVPARRETVYCTRGVSGASRVSGLFSAPAATKAPRCPVCADAPPAVPAVPAQRRDTAPDTLAVRGLEQHWTTINGVPLSRRMQTAAVVSFVGALPLTGLCFGATAYMLAKRPLAPFAALYLLYITFLDRAQKNGNKKNFWFRNLTWWRNFRDFFPISLLRTAPLDPDGRYIFGYHPHGIIGFGAISCFATEAHDFSKLFPGIDVYLVTLPINFRIPFLREIYLSLGLLDASKETFRTILSRGSGSSIAVVVGGAAESLKSEPGKMDLVIKSRKGFVRQAFLYGAQLVPVLGFGETDVFGIVRSERLLRLQRFLQKKLGFAMPIFLGRGIFQYHFGIIPHRRPIKVIFGSPIALPTETTDGRKIAELGESWLCLSDEGKSFVEAAHARYVRELERLHQDHKSSFFAGEPARLELN